VASASGTCVRVDGGARGDAGDVWKAARGPAVTGPADGSGRRTAADDGSLIGRAAELAFLRAVFSEVEQGQTAAVIVTGDSGVGKTALTMAAAAQMRAAGALVLAGSCLDIGDVSLHPVRQALRRFEAEQGGTASEPGRSQSQRGRPGADAVRIAGELRSLPDSEVPGVDGGGDLLERFAAGLSRLAYDRPLVLVVDDLHWVDQATSRLMRYLLAGLAGIRLLLIAAARLENLASTPSVRVMVSELSRLPYVRPLDLRPLGRVETDELAEGIAGRPLASAEACQVWERSQGNPFVAEALARGLRDGEVGRPETLFEIARARALALPPEALTVTRAVCVGVDPVDHTLLARIVALDDAQLIAALRTAVEQRILDVVEGGYRFHLGLVREAIESALLPSERVRMHRQYAEALAGTTGGEPQHARLAHHWRLAGESELALDALIKAAYKAERVYGYAEAAAHWAMAMELIETTPSALPDLQRIDICQAAAESAHRAGDHERALELLRRAAAALSGPTPSWMRISRARYLTAVGRPMDADAEYRLVLSSTIYPVRERAAAAAYSADLLRHLGQYADAGQRALSALDLARDDDQLTSSVVLAGAALGFSQAYLNDPVAGRKAVRDAVRAAERSASPTDIARARLYLAELLTGPLNELREGVEEARRGAARATDLGLGRTYGARLLAVAANGLFRIGEWGEAEQAVTEGFRHRPSGAEAVELLLARCRVYTGYGDLDAAEADLEAIEALTADGGAQHVLPLLILRAGLAMWRGEQGKARRAVRQGLEFYEGQSDDIVLRAILVWHGLRAEAEARTTGPEEEDEQSIRDLREVAERVQDNSKLAAEPVRDAVEGFLALAHAEISRIEGTADPRPWVQAVRVWDSRRHVYPATYARLRQAEAMYARRTRNADALVVLREAYRGARHLGARPLLAEVDRLARWARVTLEPAPPVEAPAKTEPVQRGPARVRRTDPLAALTDREREVLGLVAQGLTNQEIGGQLYISHRTAGVHVSRILAKLQVRSRVQASAIYQRVQLDEVR
jgi:DNA-binding CsgD family transcriptional regulator/tetratricopeptide (TPR) repeat protein